MNRHAVSLCNRIMAVSNGIFFYLAHNHGHGRDNDNEGAPIIIHPASVSAPPKSVDGFLVKGKKACTRVIGDGAAVGAMDPLLDSVWGQLLDFYLVSYAHPTDKRVPLRAFETKCLHRSALF